MRGGYKVYSFHGNYLVGYHKGIWDFVDSNNKLALLENAIVNSKPNTVAVTFYRVSNDEYEALFVAPGTPSETVVINVTRDDNVSVTSF